ncbi:MAG: hypothetical protein JNK10_02145 [Cyclobacteriaceae bacterium]|nr:hypothetical protein [Cyclobacteriaceae bacterium]
MKTITRIIFFLLLSSPFLVLAQQGAAKAAQKPAADCFKEWYTLFRERGAKPVTDGTQEVVITLRNNHDGSSKCYMGKIEVVGGKIKLPLWVQKDDGSYDTFGALGKKLDPGFVSSMSEEELLTVVDGMSTSFRTSDQEFGRLFFYKFIEDKPKALKKAPSPSALIKN